MADAVGAAPDAEVLTPGAEEGVVADASGSSATSTIVATPRAEEVDASGSGAVSALVATTGAEPGALGTSVMSGDGVVLDEAAEAGLVSVGVEATVLNQGRGLDHADGDDDEPSVDSFDGANVDVGSAAVCHPNSCGGLRETCWDTPTEFQGWETPAEFRARSRLPLWCPRSKLVGGGTPLEPPQVEAMSPGAKPGAVADGAKLGAVA